MDEPEIIGTPFQSPAFVEAWSATRGRVLGNDAWCLVAGKAELPLDIVRFGPLRIARFPGETHANANGWRLPPGAAAPQLSRTALNAAATSAGLRIDALDLRRIHDATWLGGEFSVTAAFEERFAISLAGGLQAVLERGNAKRKRKKFRSQERYFAERGGYRFLDVARPDRPGALAVFLEQKRQRFAVLGMPDPFAEKATDAFLETLFDHPAADTRLYAIESGGTFRALLGGIVEGETFWGMFSSFADDGDAAISPGELLLWHMVETLSAEGLAVLDLGPGEERYKRSWCDRTVPQVDALLALTLRGRAYLGLARARLAMVDRVKRNDRLRALIQRLRRTLQRA